MGISIRLKSNLKTEIQHLFSSFLFSVAYLNLGTSLIALGRCHEAASVLRDGTKLDGTGLRDRTAHENARISSLLQLGGLYADQGKLQRALAVYREALHTLPLNYPPQVSSKFLLLILMPRNLYLAVNDYPDILRWKGGGEMCNSKLISNLFSTRVASVERKLGKVLCF